MTTNLKSTRAPTGRKQLGAIIRTIDLLQACIPLLQMYDGGAPVIEGIEALQPDIEEMVAYLTSDKGAENPGLDVSQLMTGVNSVLLLLAPVTLTEAKHDVTLGRLVSQLMSTFMLASNNPKYAEFRDPDEHVYEARIRVAREQLN